MTVSPPRLRLDDEYARLVGSMLRDIRESSGATLQDAANLLLLSPSQISGLESYELRCFYSTRIFAQMLVKYAKQLGCSVDVDKLTFGCGLLVSDKADLNKSLGVVNSKLRSDGMPSEISDASIPHEWPQSPTVSERLENPNVLKKDRPPSNLLLESERGWRKSRTLHMALYGCLGLIGVFAVMPSEMASALQSIEELVHHYPNVPRDMNNGLTMAVQVQADAAQNRVAHIDADKPLAGDADADNSSGAGLIVLETTKDCWIQLNYVDGKSSQRLYSAGVYLKFVQGELSGMIIGDMSAARLTANRKAIDLIKYQKPSTNVARLLGQDAVALFGN